MRRKLPGILLFVALIALAAFASVGQVAAAVNVTVSFVHPEHFIDAQHAKGESDQPLLGIAQHLQWLGERYLPAGQTLRIEVLDVDLAGSERFLTRAGREVRIDNGRADWPQIKLRYVLQANGSTLQQGEEVVSDMNYLNHINSYSDGDPLRYEKLMLEEWFRGRFAKR